MIALSWHFHLNLYKLTKLTPKSISDEGLSLWVRNNGLKDVVRWKMSNLETFWMEPEWMDDCVVNEDSRGRWGFPVVFRFSQYISPSQESWQPQDHGGYLGCSALGCYAEGVPSWSPWRETGHEQCGFRSRCGWRRLKARGQLEEKGSHLVCLLCGKAGRGGQDPSIPIVLPASWEKS